MMSFIYVNVKCGQKKKKKNQQTQNNEQMPLCRARQPFCFCIGLELRILCSWPRYALWDGCYVPTWPFHLHIGGELQCFYILAVVSCISPFSYFQLSLQRSSKFSVLLWSGKPWTDRDVTILTWFWFLLLTLLWDVVFPWGLSMKKQKMHLPQFCCPACFCSINAEWSALWAATAASLPSFSGFLRECGIMPQQLNFISAPQSNVADGRPWEPADPNWVSCSTPCVQGSSCSRVQNKGWSLNQSESHRWWGLPLPPAPQFSASSSSITGNTALPLIKQQQQQNFKNPIDQISYPIPPASVEFGW